MFDRTRSSHAKTEGPAAQNHPNQGRDGAKRKKLSCFGQDSYVISKLNEASPQLNLSRTLMAPPSAWGLYMVKSDDPEGASLSGT